MRTITTLEQNGVESKTQPKAAVLNAAPINAAAPAAPADRLAQDESALSNTAQIARRAAFRYSAGLLVAAAVLLIVSIFLPYWKMRLNAPQYPGGLTVSVYVNHMEGDMREIDMLNHYIGMAPLEDAAQLERSLAPFALATIVLMIISLAFIHSKWGIILGLPAIGFPFVFLLDMWVWLWYYGNNLDPTAALSSSIEPFTPTILGTGYVGQFSTTAWLQPGWYLAFLASLLTAAAIYLRDRANAKPADDAAV